MGNLRRAALAAALAATPSTAADFQAAIQDAQKKIFPATVHIRVVQENFADGAQVKAHVSGTGVIVSSDGFVLTNYHVVEKAAGVRCLLYDRRQLEAEVIGKDQETDLALLRLRLPPGASLPFARLGDSGKLKEGDFVMAMGCPFGLSRSISFGVVSNPDQFIRSASAFNNWIQTDASINPGNSGGPLVDLEGRVVGINTLSIGGTVGFAIPSRVVDWVLPELRAKGKVARSWSGVGFRPLEDFEKDRFESAESGAIVEVISPGGPAEEAGLRPGDLVLSVGGEALVARYAEEIPEVRRRLAALAPEVPVPVAYSRGGESRTATLKPRLKGRIEGETRELEEWMLTLKEINRFSDPEAHHFRERGCLVSGVRAGGNAARSGLSPGDILVRVEGREIAGLEDARLAYEEALKRQGERKVLLELVRWGRPRMLVLDYKRSRAAQEEEK